MVQWFHLVSLALSNRLASYVGYLFSFTLRVTWDFLKVTVIYISWFSDFALYLRQYQIGRHHTLDACSVWHCQWPYPICRSLGLKFHNQVILSCITDLILYKDVILFTKANGGLIKRSLGNIVIILSLHFNGDLLLKEIIFFHMRYFSYSAGEQCSSSQTTTLQQVCLFIPSHTLVAEYSRTSMARTPLWLRKLVRDMGGSAIEGWL